MKILSFLKDGGPKSKVWGYFFIEIKSLFSIVLLRFSDGSREAYHSHAFNCFSWVLRGLLHEQRMLNNVDSSFKTFEPSLKPFVTTRDNLHKVASRGTTWVLSFRGPWGDTWKEIDESGNHITLTHGRVEV